MERYIVVDNVCGWPKLSLMPDGSLMTSFHNRPSHGSLDGYTELWSSSDGGRSFKWYADVKPEGATSTDRAMGVTHSGELIVCANRRQADTREFLPSTVTRIDGSGNAKTSILSFNMIAFGKIIQIPDSRKLMMTVWDRENWDDVESVYRSFAVLSQDDGESWEIKGEIGCNLSETEPLFFDAQHGIAAARSSLNHTTDLYRTRDGGETWQYERNLAGPNFCPASLVRLSNGDILLTTGVRLDNMQGILASVLSPDAAKTKCSNLLAAVPGGRDGGYPSTVQMPDGSMVTLYYSKGNMYHTRYHVGSIIWRLEELLENRWTDRPAWFGYGTDKEIVSDWQIR